MPACESMHACTPLRMCSFADSGFFSKVHCARNLERSEHFHSSATFDFSQNAILPNLHLANQGPLFAFATLPGLKILSYHGLNTYLSTLPCHSFDEPSSLGQVGPICCIVPECLSFVLCYHSHEEVSFDDVVHRYSHCKSRVIVTTARQQQCLRLAHHPSMLL